MATVDKAYTIEDLIKYGSYTTQSYMKYSYKEVLSNRTIVSSHNVLWDYLNELKSISINIKLSDTEMSRYRFKPKLLCKEIYGNGELYFIILMINNMADMKDFTEETLLMPRRADLNNLLVKIYNVEKKSLNSYNGGSTV